MCESDDSYVIQLLSHSQKHWIPAHHLWQWSYIVLACHSHSHCWLAIVIDHMILINVRLGGKTIQSVYYNILLIVLIEHLQQGPGSAFAVASASSFDKGKKYLCSALGFVFMNSMPRLQIIKNHFQKHPMVQHGCRKKVPPYSYKNRDPKELAPLSL